MPLQVLQRNDWDGHPVDLGDAWVLRKGHKAARCSLVTHQLGFELRLVTTDLLRSQVCGSSEEVLNTHEAWKSAMVATGSSAIHRNQEEDQPVPGEQPVLEEVAPIDDAPVPPLTTPDDTEGG
jgi:hypothetical protein